MAKIEITQSPISQAVSSIPDILLRAAQLGQSQSMKQQQFDLQQQQIDARNTQQALDMELKKKQLGMDAAGYDNTEIVDYFNKIMLQPGTIDVDGGNLTWTGNQLMPKQEEAWAEYKKLATKGGKTITSSDYAMFNDMWIQTVSTRDRRLQSEIKKVQRMGYDTDDIENMMAENILFGQNISSVMDYVSPESQQFYAGFMPKKATSGLYGDVGLGGTGLALTGAAALGEAGYRMATATPANIIDEANKKVLDAEDKLRKAMKSKAKNKDALIKRAQKLVNTAKAESKDMISKGQKYKQYTAPAAVKGLKSFQGLKGFAPTLFGSAAGMAGEMIGGEEVGAVAKGVVGGGVASSQAVARTMGLGQYVANRLAYASPKMAAKFGIAAMADSPALPIGDFIGLVMAAGTGYDVVTKAIDEWNKANK